MATIRVTAFEWVPPPFQGQVRDLAVRWALEEVGLPYEEKLLAAGENRSAAHRAVHPFGKVPVYEEDGLALFESGAIVLHIAERAGLLPQDPTARAQVRAWVIAALNSVDPNIIALGDIDHFHAGEAWAIARRPAVLSMVETKLNDVAAHLDGRDFLAGNFSAADIMMIMVLRQLRHTRIVEGIPALAAWRDRCEARPAFKRALAAQLAPFALHSPADGS